MVKLFLEQIYRQTGELVDFNMLSIAGLDCIDCPISRRQADVFSLVAGEEGAVFALEELLATVTVPVVAAEALHVARAELTELTGEDAVWSIVWHRQATGRRAGRHLTAGRQLVMTELLTNISRLQVRWI